MIDLSKLRGASGRKVDLPAQTLAYKRAFGSPEGKLHIMPDLIEFTGFLRPAPDGDSLFAQGRAQGRRDVMLRILGNLHLSSEELYAMLKGQPIIKPEDFA